MQDISEEEGKEDAPIQQESPKSIVIGFPEIIEVNQEGEIELEHFREKMISKLKQMKKKILSIDIKNKNNYKDHMNKYVLYFLKEEFGSFDNFLMHAINYEPTKLKIESLLQQFCDYQPRESLLEQGFKNGMEVCVKVLQTHFRAISYKIRNLHGVTEDIYNSIRDL